MMLKFLSLLCKMDEQTSLSGGAAGASAPEEQCESVEDSSYLTFLIGSALPDLLKTVFDILDGVIIHSHTSPMAQPPTAPSASGIEILLDDGTPELNNNNSEKKNKKKKQQLDATKINHQIACIAQLSEEALELLARFQNSDKFAVVGSNNNNNVGGGEEQQQQEKQLERIQKGAVAALESFMNQLTELRMRLPLEEVIEEEDEGEAKSNNGRQQQQLSSSSSPSPTPTTQQQAQQLADLKSLFLRLSRTYNEAQHALMARSAPALAVSMRSLLHGIKSIGDAYRNVDVSIAEGIASMSSTSSSSSSSVAAATSKATTATTTTSSSSSSAVGLLILPIPPKDALAYAKLLRELACLSLRTLITIHDGSAAAQSNSNNNNPMMMNANSGSSNNNVVSAGGATCSTDLFVQSAAIQIISFLLLMRLDGSRGLWLASVVKRGLLMAVPLPSPPTNNAASPAATTAIRPPAAGVVGASPAPSANDFPIPVAADKRNAMSLLLLEVLSAIVDAEEEGVLSSSSSVAVSSSASSSHSAAPRGGTTTKLIDSAPLSIAPLVGGGGGNNNATVVNASAAAAAGASSASASAAVNVVSLFDTLVRIATANLPANGNGATANNKTAVPSPAAVVPPPTAATNTSLIRPSGAAPITFNYQPTMTTTTMLMMQPQQQPHDRRLTVAALQLLGRTCICLTPRVSLLTLLDVCKDVFRSPNMTMMGRAAVSASVTYVAVSFLVNGGGGAVVGGAKGADHQQKQQEEELLLLANFAQHLVSYAPFPSSTSASSSSGEKKKITLITPSTRTTTAEDVAATVPFGLEHDDPDLQHVEVIRSHGALIKKALDEFKEKLAARLANSSGGSDGNSAGGLAGDVEMLRRMESAGKGHNVVAAGGTSSCSNTIGSSSAGALRVAAQHLLVNARQKARSDLSKLSSFSQDLKKATTKNASSVASSSVDDPAATIIAPSSSLFLGNTKK